MDAEATAKLNIAIRELDKYTNDLLAELAKLEPMTAYEVMLPVYQIQGIINFMKNDN